MVLDGLVYLILLSLYFSFSRAALWVGTTSFMILVLPVVFETERLQLEQQQLQQQRQVCTAEMAPCIFMLSRCNEG